MVKKYQAPNCAVIEFNRNEDVITGSVQTSFDANDTYTSWDEIFGGVQ